MGRISNEVPTNGGIIWCHHINQLWRRVLPKMEDSDATVPESESDPNPPVEQTVPSRVIGKKSPKSSGGTQ